MSSSVSVIRLAGVRPGNTRRLSLARQGARECLVWQAQHKKIGRSAEDGVLMECAQKVMSSDLVRAARDRIRALSYDARE